MKIIISQIFYSVYLQEIQKNGNGRINTGNCKVIYCKGLCSVHSTKAKWSLKKTDLKLHQTGTA